jgi:hypothetical protein
MEHAGDQALAAACLALEQHRGQAAARFTMGDEAPDLVPNGLDRRALSDQLGQGIHRALALPLLLN